MRVPIGRWPHHMILSSHPIGWEASAGRGSNFWLRSSAVWTELATWQSRYIFIKFRCDLTASVVLKRWKSRDQVILCINIRFDTVRFLYFETKTWRNNWSNQTLQGKLNFQSKTQSSIGNWVINWFCETSKLLLQYDSNQFC